MDPLGAAPSTVEAETLPRWSASTPPNHESADPLNSKPSPFPANEVINGKIVLWDGDIAALNILAITSTTNESLTDMRHPATRRIFENAGPQLAKECRQRLQSCRTGEAKITNGYNLAARHVIHTVGPRYNLKYKTAAESALFSCYRSVLQLAREQKITSVGIGLVHSHQRGYPPEEGVHIALRTVRRFLEKWSDAFDTIVFAIEGADVNVYRKAMPLYFPRNKDEEQFVLQYLPEDLGNEDGEPVIADRQIRISENPLSTARSDDDDDLEDEEDLAKVGAHSFARMSGDHDMQRREALQGRTRDESAAAERDRLYQRLLRRARTEDMSDMARLRALYTSGVDYMGRPVVVFVARNLPASTVDVEKAISYFIHVLHPVVDKDYVVVYFHTQSSSENHPELSLLRQLYDLVDNRYRRHLRAFYIVHPTIWSKLATWFFTTFTASSIKDKVHNLDGVQYLYDSINPDQLQVPQFVLDYDTQINGLNYYTPQGRETVDTTNAGL